MKIILIGANGTIGELVQKALAGAGHEIVEVGHKFGDFQVEIENRESVRKLYQAVGSFDAVAIAAGQVAFAPLTELTAEKWQFSLGSKLMGQVNLVQEAIPFIKEKGSFTLVSGILNDDPIVAGVAASTVSGALEAFVRAAAIELPKGLRINVVSPTMLKESESQFAQFFTGMIPVEGWKVGQAYKRAIWGHKPAAFTRLIELIALIHEPTRWNRGATHAAVRKFIQNANCIKEIVMSQTTQERNKALVLEAFDTLFNKRDYEAAQRYWSPTYIQHSAHIAPGREGLFNLIKSTPPTLKYEPGVIVADGDLVIVHGRFSGLGAPVNTIAADIVRIEAGVLVEHWDVLQNEATQEQSKSGRPMFGDSFPVF